MSHTPKQMALEALVQGRLSREGRARLERHLDDCATCREAHAAIRAYEALRDEARAEEMPALDFSKMELALAREAKKVASAEKQRFAPVILLALAAAAAALLVIGLSQRGEQARDRHRAPPPETAVAIEAPRDRVEGEVTVVAGEVVRLVGGRDSEVTLGSTVTEGEAFRTPENGEVHFRLEEGRGLALLSGSAMRIEQLREGRIVAALEHGTVANQVRHLEAGDQYEVLAGGWEVHVRGTRFSVTREGDDIDVLVEEGVVEVRRGDESHRIEAPGYFSSRGRARPDGDLVRPYALEAAMRRWPRIRLPAVDLVSGYRLNGGRFPASGLEMRVPEGHTSIEVLDDVGGVIRVLDVDVGRDGLDLDPAAVRPRAPRAREGYLPPEVISAVVTAGQRRLQRCQETASRTGSDVIGRFALRIDIDRMGEVSRAELTGQTPMPDAAFVQCVEENARAWSFPAPEGGTVSVSVPIRFGTAPTLRRSPLEPR